MVQPLSDLFNLDYQKEKFPQKLAVLVARISFAIATSYLLLNHTFLILIPAVAISPPAMGLLGGYYVALTGIEKMFDSGSKLELINYLFISILGICIANCYKKIKIPGPDLLKTIIKRICQL